MLITTHKIRMNGLEAETAQKTYENMLVPKIEDYNYQDDNYKKNNVKVLFPVKLSGSLRHPL